MKLFIYKDEFFKVFHKFYQYIQNEKDIYIILIKSDHKVNLKIKKFKSLTKTIILTIIFQVQ